MPAAFSAPGAPENYTIGGMRFRFTETGGTQLDFGNVVTGSFASALSFLDHYSSKTGTRNKDRSIVQQISISIKLTCDEPTEELMNLFTLGATITAHAWSPYAKTERAGAAVLFGLSDTGNEFKWDIWKCIVKPDGDFTFNDQDWSKFAFIVDILDDSAGVGHAASPFGTITHSGHGANLTPP